MINASALNQELYSTILDEASILEKRREDIPELLYDITELRMDVKFVLVDLQTIMRACSASEKFYEKRYHLKNIYAGMLEGYKLLYGFGNMRKHTVWARIATDLDKAIKEDSPYRNIWEDFKTRHEEITSRLTTIESTNTDRDDRNLTYHYDDDLLLVYRLTLKMDSEEKASLKYMDFMKVLGSMLEFTNLIEIAEELWGRFCPKSLDTTMR